MTVLTAPATLNLATPRALSMALAALGIQWSPVPMEQLLTDEPGLYAWVIGGEDAPADLLDRPVAYVGIGRGREGGLRQRLRDEQSWVGGSAGHIHGRAMHRLDGRPVGDHVNRILAADLGWLDQTIPEPAAATALRPWLDADKPGLVEKAEQLCIRAAAHIGDTAPPVNSQHTTAWASYAPADWGGWAVAQHLLSSSSS